MEERRLTGAVCIGFTVSELLYREKPINFIFEVAKKLTNGNGNLDDVIEEATDRGWADVVSILDTVSCLTEGRDRIKANELAECLVIDYIEVNFELTEVDCVVFDVVFILNVDKLVKK